MFSLSHQETANQAWSLYHTVLSRSAPSEQPFPTSSHRYSAHNLLAYLAYKDSVTPGLLAAFRQRGLELSSTEHMLRSLQVLLYNLGIVPPSAANVDEQLASIIRQRSDTLFGERHKESPHIMITLDAQMLSSPIIEELLRNGMTIARINCAYGDERTWRKLIETVRGAEERLRAEGAYQGRGCKIYMDLAGPKIRVGPFRTSVNPLKMKVKKDALNRPVMPKLGVVLPNGAASKLSDGGGGGYDFELAVFADGGVHELQEGDTLSFLDARSKMRKLVITKVLSHGWEVSLPKSAYIDEHTKLRNAERRAVLQVVNLERIPEKLRVKKGDVVRIVLDGRVEGHYDSGTHTTNISVTLPGAFKRIMEGHRVYIDDGKIQGVVRECAGHYVDVEITAPEVETALKPYKGINIPDSEAWLSVASITEKDREDLAFICRHADMAGVSFLHRPEDLRALKRLLAEYGRENLPVIAKIETKEAVRHFSSLLIEGLTYPAFGVMVARGDLAIEAGFQPLSVIQEEILSMCRAAHIPVILATQVLDTLAKKGVPSRSELADISFGSQFDCIMLNKGSFMKEAVAFLLETLILISETKDFKQSITRPETKKLQRPPI